MGLPSKEEYEKLTPMMRQYYDIKATALDCILFFRMGDFYEIFGDDALQVAPKLELVLTARGSGGNNKTPFCGVPHHAAKNYWLKLLKLGYKVAIVDQVEDPKETKGIVRREITKVFTPGAIDDLEGLESDRANYIAAYYENPNTRTFSLCVADLSTGSLKLGEFKTLTDVIEYLKNVDPSEVLTRKFSLDTDKAAFAESFYSVPAFSILPEGPLRSSDENKKVFKKHFSANSLSKLPCGEVSGGIEIICALLSHFKSLKASTEQFLTVKPLVEPETMDFDSTALRDLEIFETSQRREFVGSLYHEVCRSLTPMGKRHLRDMFLKPFVSQDKIASEHNAVEAILSDKKLLTDLREELKNFSDLARLRTRIVGRSAAPRELKLVETALSKSKNIYKLLNSSSAIKKALGKDILNSLKKFDMPLSHLEQALCEEVSQLGKGSEVFKSGYDKKLDEYVSFSEKGQDAVDQYEAKLKEETSIASLKIKFHKTFGLVIEVTKSNLSKVPSSFIRRQTMVNNERFVTPELQELDEKLAESKEKSIEREWQLYCELLEKLSTLQVELLDIANAIAKIDYSQGLAAKALESNYCKPQLVKEGIELMASRHPVVDSMIGRHKFTPNDIHMKKGSRHLLITGPNMAGKSTVMRQVAICALLNQIGSFVPAESASLPIFDKIFTRVGASDDLSQGKSTFMVEMSEVANILRQATDHSLLILDEVGRGTSTQDGLAIAESILSYIAKDLGCYSMFATHYHELALFSEKLKDVKNMKTEVTERNGEIYFSHVLSEGASGSSFGIEVAELAGLPASVIKEAKNHIISQKSSTSEQSKSEEQPRGPIDLFELAAMNTVDEPKMTRALVDESQLEVMAHIREFDINRATPLEALNLMAHLKSLTAEHKGHDGTIVHQ